MQGWRTLIIMSTFPVKVKKDIGIMDIRGVQLGIYFI